MSSKLLNLPHKVCGYTCMINGIEDQYEAHTGQRLPDWLLFFLSGMGEFVYIKNLKTRLPFQSYTSGHTRIQYERLSHLLGFTWQYKENRSFKWSLTQVIQYLDAGQPVVLGALDMFHLPYFKHFFQKVHIPIHYIMAVGYDTEKACLWVSDNDRPEVEMLPFDLLEKAWDVATPGMSKPRTFFTFQFSDATPDIDTLVIHGLRVKAANVLHPPVKIMGVPGLRKLAKELPEFPQWVSPDVLEACLRQFVEYTGLPPTTPPALLPFKANIPDNHHATRDVLADLLRQLSISYHQPGWQDVATLLDQSGDCFNALTNHLCSFILKQTHDLQPAVDLITQIADLEEKAYHLLA